MRLMDDKGRLFGKVNIFDLLVLLLVIVGLVGMSLRMIPSQEEVAVTKTAIYQVEIVGAREYLKDAYQIGDVLYEGENFVGTITDVQIENSKYWKRLADGTMKQVEQLYGYDIKLTFTTDEFIENKGYHVDTAEWLAGTSHFISNGFASATVVVRSIEIQ